MADEKVSTELQELAFDIYARRMASASKRAPAQEAVDAFRLAEEFLKVRTAIGKGEMKAKDALEGVQLADCSCPNQKRTHPHNLISQRFGSLDRVQKIKAWLDKHPTPEKEPEELLHQLNREFPDLSWDLPAVNIARSTFPAFCKN